MTSMVRGLRLLPVVLAVFSCGGGSNSKDPLKNLTARVDLYVTNTPTSYPTELTGTAGSTWSNRPVQFTFQNYSDKITKFELTRTSNGVSTTCEIKNADGLPMVNSNLRDWAAASTKYTLTVTADTFTKTFDFDITVQSAERIVTAGASLSDQSNDMITTGGSFFQTRTVDIGGGGYTGPNFNSSLVQYMPRLIDFAVLTTGGSLKIVSPSLINATATFDRIKNDCGFQTTTFVAYTGALDPTTMGPLTLAEVAALPDPPASATSITPTAGLKFVYKTSDGKKGLVTVDTVTATSVGLHFSSAQ